MIIYAVNVSTKGWNEACVRFRNDCRSLVSPFGHRTCTARKKFVICLRVDPIAEGCPKGGRDDDFKHAKRIFSLAAIPTVRAASHVWLRIESLHKMTKVAPRHPHSPGKRIGRRRMP